MEQLYCTVVMVLMLLAEHISISDGAAGDWKNPPVSTSTRSGTLPQSIPENLPVGQSPAFVAVESASFYRIVSQPVDGLFVIHNNGSINITSSLDYENATSYTFVVEATYGVSTTTTATVTINIADKNDNEPRFPGDPYLFRLPDNSTEGTFVGKVTAIDEDRSFWNENIEKYSIKAGRDSETFFIIPSSGLIYVGKDRMLSTADKLNYTFTVEASDTGFPRRTGSTDVTVCVACPIMSTASGHTTTVCVACPITNGGQPPVSSFILIVAVIGALL